MPLAFFLTDSLRNPFVFLRDYLATGYGPWIRNHLPWAWKARFLNYRPLTALSFSLTYHCHRLPMRDVMNDVPSVARTRMIQSRSKEKKSELDLNSYFLNKVKNDYEIISYIKPFINTFSMFCIMTSVLTREELSISIILLFLIRMYLNKINDLIIEISDNSKIKKSLINQIKKNVLNI